MSELNARESFALWCGRHGVAPGDCAALRSLGQRLHTLATRECNEGLGKADSVRKDRAIRKGRTIAEEYGLSLSSSDGWLTARLHEPDTDPIRGHALPRNSAVRS